MNKFKIIGIIALVAIVWFIYADWSYQQEENRRVLQAQLTEQEKQTKIQQMQYMRGDGSTDLTYKPLIPQQQQAPVHQQTELFKHPLGLEDIRPKKTSCSMLGSTLNCTTY